MASLSVPATIICRSTISYINQHLDEPGKSYIFVNGVNNNIDDAEGSALNVSRWLNDKRVVLFHNPTRLEDQRATAEQTNLLVNGLLYLIQNELRKCQDTLQERGEIKVFIFSHSHGSVLTKNAMHLLESGDASRLESTGSMKDKVEVISFGGGVLIPNNIASKVHNFVNEFDLVPLLANSPVPSNSDADQLLKLIGSEGKIQQIFSEILLYQHTEASSGAAQAVKSALVGHHQIEHFGKQASSFEEIRDEKEAISRGVESGVVLFEGFLHKVFSSLSDTYAVSIQKLSDHPTIDIKASKMLAQVIRDPYSGKAIINAITLMLQKKINLFEAHKLDTYLQSVSQEKVFS